LLRVVMSVEPASPEPSGLFGHRSGPGPGGISVAVLTLLPKKVPVGSSTPGLALPVSRSYVSVAGTAHLYQTERRRDATPELPDADHDPGRSAWASGLARAGR
jgi:hypothetical protein